MILNKFNYTDFTSHLLAWYDGRSLALPWRDCNDPYKIYLSEVMLQQTQVKTVLPYYKKWVNKYPTVQSVANATQEQILKQWEGLGYYGRARNFHKSCQIIALKFDGDIPDLPEEFSKLPGVGPYISAAVMSIAFHHPLPAVDTNAVRVAARLKMVAFSSPADSKIIHRYLSDNIAIKRPGDFNQAIMDLGREICKSENPKCTRCPVSKFCNALVNNFVDKYPIKIKPDKKPHYNIAVGIIWNKGQILISKRRESGLLGGLWEFPGGKIEGDESAENCILREIKEELGVHVRPTTFLKQIKHAYTHFSITMDAYNCEFLHGCPQPLGCDDWRWIRPEQIKTLPFPRANHKLFDKIIVEEGVC
jgi:A/G-specific adenine glycosylase